MEDRLAVLQANIQKNEDRRLQKEAAQSAAANAAGSGQAGQAGQDPSKVNPGESSAKSGADSGQHKGSALERRLADTRKAPERPSRKKTMESRLAHRNDERIRQMRQKVEQHLPF